MVPRRSAWLLLSVAAALVGCSFDLTLPDLSRDGPQGDAVNDGSQERRIDRGHVDARRNDGTKVSDGKAGRDGAKKDLTTPPDGCPSPGAPLTWSSKGGGAPACGSIGYAWSGGGDCGGGSMSSTGPDPNAGGSNPTGWTVACSGRAGGTAHVGCSAAKTTVYVGALLQPTSTASCGTSYTLVGGGCDCTGGDVLESYPQCTGNTCGKMTCCGNGAWKCTCSTGTSARARAICVPDSSLTGKAVWTESASATTVSCLTYRLIGGGCDAPAASNPVQASMPKPCAKATWACTFKGAGGTTYALCTDL